MGLVYSLHPIMPVLLILDASLGSMELARNALKTGFSMPKMSAFLFQTFVSPQIILEIASPVIKVMI